jgi:hypothetical protein
VPIDVTSIIAGRDIIGFGAAATPPAGSYYLIYGPGRPPNQVGHEFSNDSNRRHSRPRAKFPSAFVDRE